MTRRVFDRALDRLLRNGLILRSIARLGGPEPAAAVLTWLTLRGQIPVDRLTVLWSRRPQFSKDVSELKTRTGIHFLEFSKARYQAMLEAWVPWPMRRQVFFQGESGWEADRARRMAKDFAVAFLRRLRRKQRIDAVLAANINYWQDEGLGAACSEMRLPFLVLSREHPLTRLSADWIRVLHRLHRFRFRGDGVAVFGALTRDALVAGEACKPEQIWITGAPRFDAWHEVDLRLCSRDCVALMSYGEPTYFAVENYREAVLAFGRASARVPDCRFVLKCKNEFNVRLAMEILAELPAHSVSVEMTTPLTELFPRCKLIAGFNSLSLLEGLLAQARIVVPHWKDARRPAEDLLFAPDDPILSQVVAFADSPEAFEGFLVAGAQTPHRTPPAEDRSAILHRYCHVPENGTASDAVAQFIHYHVKHLNGVTDQAPEFGASCATQ